MAYVSNRLKNRPLVLLFEFQTKQNAVPNLVLFEQKLIHCVFSVYQYLVMDTWFSYLLNLFDKLKTYPRVNSSISCNKYLLCT